MASVLATVLDDLRAIIDGSSSLSPIAAGRYRAVEYDPATLPPAAAQRPWPYEVQVGGRTQPTEYPSDISGDHAYYGREATIRVAYAGEPHEGEDQQDAIVTDEDEITLALEDASSWSATDWVACRVTGSSLAAVPILGSETGNEMDLMRILEIQIALVYRETRP